MTRINFFPSVFSCVARKTRRLIRCQKKKKKKKKKKPLYNIISLKIHLEHAKKGGSKTKHSKRKEKERKQNCTRLNKRKISGQQQTQGQ
ncbi:hypothetical protein I7I53_06869 [Histoplasma capsulatum var. duboisii H88]|uniref:Uncharacterized protein n=1 Tax=Ajellomyces capsulatus (strain H88) TaxID=544711 RepID=A0A8A1LGF2_AJEC8|nr:hypothetical protein I7I53_06869 [Histoplasma capsulatum var. duboisii H88]